VKGIDCSKWQGNINWEEVKKAGYSFAIIRDGYGKTGIDKMFEVNYQGAKRAGLNVGVYHYSYADSTADAKKEAEFCLKNIEGKQFEFPIVYDIEDSEMLALTTEQRTNCCYAFCEAIENAGYYAMVYANPNWLKNYLYGDKLTSVFDLWLAQWGAKEPSYQCGIWQHTDQGKVPGIIGNVDLDISYKNYPEIMKAKGLNGFGGNAPSNGITGARYYTVKAGDSLTKIAVKYNTTVDKIAIDNGIRDKNKIYVGQTLRV